MLAHRLIHSVNIQEPIEEQNPLTGEMTIIWVNIELSPGKPNIPAEVLTGAGREVISSASKHAEVDARINMRWFPYDQQSLYKCRILWEGQVFGIVSVETDKTARQEWRFKCKAGVSTSGI
ncbi:MULTISPECIES: head-tail adaptor protein [Vibrio]|uniref:head-tail adaptor protein n=1 Tax=Vibrio TaxID=662 RepID=UPI000933882A|nr:MULTISPECIES: head-tail adaptor protein [Vibrio]MCG3743087.1 head-tail adaptor protein [Vibrio cincinnatiensis]